MGETACSEIRGKVLYPGYVLAQDHQWPLDIGEKVKQLFFPATPPIVFNVCFSCAKPTLLHGGDYANPHSHWFNVFFGFYEIDVPKDAWQRPFGYKAKTEDAVAFTELDFDELARIGKSDWNYFSNFIYGVPDRECSLYVNKQPRHARVVNPAVQIKNDTFIEAEVEGLEVVSGYVSGRDGKKLVNNNGIFSPIWRAVFGRPKTQADCTSSFVPTTMKMRFYIRYEADVTPDADLGVPTYRTFIFGGAINERYKGSVDNDAFLNAQMTAVREAAKANGFRKHPSPKRKAPWHPSRHK